MDELERCPASKKALLYDYLGKIAFTTLEVDEEATILTQRILEFSVLKPKHFYDCQHIAVAVVNGCDIILSWNFRHMVNVKTIRGVRAVTNLEGYKGIDIVNPSALLHYEDKHE